jgi:hypothetical protein
MNNESSATYRVAIVVNPCLDVATAANAIAVAAAGLRCPAFDAHLTDAAGFRHAAVKWNTVILRPKTLGQFERFADACRTQGHDYVLFTRTAQGLSNSYEEYREVVAASVFAIDAVAAIAMFGPDVVVRQMTKAFSTYR